MNFARLSSSSLVLAITVSLAGCPSDPGGVPANVPLADLPGVLAPAMCGIYADCGGPVVTLVYGNEADCAAQLAARFSDGEIGTLQAAIDAGNIAYHGDLVGDCIAALNAAGCALGNPFETCEGIFEGLVDDGGACELNEECGDGSYCAISGACPGACQARVMSGATCSSSDGCQPGLVCTSGSCRAPAGEGAACEGTTGVSCSNIGLTCAGSDGATAGTCAQLASFFSGAVGEICDPDMEDLCDEGISCAFDGLDGTSPRFRCVARVAAGAACTIALPDMCPDDQFCSGVSLMGTPDVEGTCAPLPTAGEPCTVPVGVPVPRCAARLVCVGTMGTNPGTCEVLGRLGASCASDATCASSLCTSGTCAPGEPGACRTGP